MKFVAEYFGISEKEVEQKGKKALKEFSRVWALKPRTTDEEVRDAYKSTDVMIYRHAWHNRKKNFASFTKLIKAGDSVLDYGAGIGKVFEPIFGRVDIKVSLADIDCPVFDFVKWKYGDKAHFITVGLDNKPLKAVYTHIACLDVLEHIPDPLPVFEHLVEHLAEGGYLLLSYSKKRGKVSHLDSAIDKREIIYSIIRKKMDYLKKIEGCELYKLNT